MQTFYRYLCKLFSLFMVTIIFFTPVQVSASDTRVIFNKYHIFDASTTKRTLTSHITRVIITPDILTLAFVGDINLDENWATTKFLDQQPNGIYDCISPELITKMQQADILMVNNEFTYSTRGTPLKGKTWTFRANPSRIEVLKELGTDIALMANNHCYDYGEDGLHDTLQVLKDANIPYVGAGTTLESAIRPYYFVYDDLIIAYVAASNAEINRKTPQATNSTGGVLLCYDPSLFLETIQNASKNADIVIANVHWGTEYSNYTVEKQHQLAYDMIDAGADAIVGSHPHVLQGIEYYKEKPILYSLGNFWFNEKTMYTCLYELEIDTTSKKISGVKFTPATQKGCQTILATDYKTQRKIWDFEEKISFDIEIDDYGYIHSLTTE